jgi:hypothetical protein
MSCNKCGCKCNEECSCHQNEECQQDHCHEHHHDHFSDELLELADEAWMDVLFDKIKEEVEQHSGEHITKLAQLVSRTNHDRWKSKLAGKASTHAFRHELRELMDRQPKK